MNNYRKQRGSGEVIVILAIIFVISFNYLITNDFSSNRKHLDIDGKVRIDKFKALPEPVIHPQGRYLFEEDGEDFTAEYYFGKNDKIVKSTVSGALHFQGEAKYHFEGSVMIFKEVSGDAGLFSLDGEAITITNMNSIVSHSTDRDYELKLSNSKEILPSSSNVKSNENTLILPDKVFTWIFQISIFVFFVILVISLIRFMYITATGKI